MLGTEKLFDVFYGYTRCPHEGDLTDVLEKALSDKRTEDLVWLYLLINEIPWQEISIKPALRARYEEQGVKATRQGIAWKHYTEIMLGRTFKVWYEDQYEPIRTIERREEIRWKENLLLLMK